MVECEIVAEVMTFEAVKVVSALFVVGRIRSRGEKRVEGTFSRFRLNRLFVWG